MASNDQACETNREHLSPEYQIDWHPVFVATVSTEISLEGHGGHRAETNRSSNGIFYELTINPKFDSQFDYFELRIKIEARGFYLVAVNYDEKYTGRDAGYFSTVIPSGDWEHIMDMESKPRCVRCQIYRFSNFE